METHGQPPELPITTDSFNPDTPSPIPADPIIMHTKDPPVALGEVFLGKQVRQQERPCEGRSLAYND